MYPVRPEEAADLERLLTMHAKATGSKKAGEILAAFAQYLPKFRAVISDEYLAYLQNKGA
jgi:glutamate synthase domain-containing protein 3